MSDAPLVEIENLCVAFDGRPAVRGVSFRIERGESVALVGESGSGKSVTALSILQLLPGSARHPSGSIRVDGEEVIGAPKARLRQIRGDRITMVFQEPMTSLNPLHTIERQIAEMLLVHRRMSRPDARARTLELLLQVGLQDAERRLQAYPHELSGGQRQRVMIAMALANSPHLLIADEPTTALDVTVQAQILELLARLQAELGMALLLITHDLSIVRKLSSRVHVMQNGEIVEHGPTEKIFASPRHAYTRELLHAELDAKPRVSVSDGAPLLRTRDLHVHFPIMRTLFGVRGEIRAVDGISIDVHEGRTLGVVGESGSGKTTLGMAILRLVASQGEIEYAGRAIHSARTADLRTLRREMQIVFQDPYGSLSPRLSVQQIVEEGLLVHEPDLHADDRRARVATALDEVGLPADALDRYPHEFSGGQRQRIAVARAMILRPRLVVLDEPTSALDMSIQSQLVHLLLELQQRHGLSYIFISHDLRVVRALADDVLVMRDGKAVEHGPAHEIFDAPRTPYTRALIRAAFDLAT